jgi:mono/diheme cytochrome c family protein
MSPLRRSRWAIALATAIVIGACGDNAPDGTDVDVRRGEAAYQVACIACHATAGEGIDGLGNPLADSEFIASVTDDELFEFIVLGRGTNDPDNTSGIAMPPRGGRPNLSDAEIRDIIAYLSSLQ